MDLLALMLLITLSGTFGLQSWQEEPRYTEVNPGESALLVCKIINQKGACSWQKDGKPQGLFEGKVEWGGDQSKGDCSIRIFDAAEVDDGDWECQVTASSFSSHDALTSQIARLVVRVAPKPPQLEVGSSQVSGPHNFTVREGIPSAIKCISRYGNPPAKIKWFLGSEELPLSTYNESNMTEIDRPKTWTTVSTLRTSFVKADHSRSLRCVSVHEAYDTKSKDVSIALDIQYAPTVTLQGSPTDDIEEGKDRVTLQCLADANPPANIIWKRVGETNVFSFQEMVEFNPANQKHSGTYTCKASNAVGVSDPLSVRLDIKYPPKIIEVGPEPIVTAGLHNTTVLKCHAKGNPPPSFEWIQVMPTSRKVQRGSNSTLVIDNITYEHQGQYFCIAYNIIKGSRKDVHSKPVVLEVTGAPQVLRYSVDKQVEVQRGDDAVIKMSFCSDPQPLRTTWEWGSHQLDAGDGNGRHVAERLSQDVASSDCYQARLRVQHADMTDARNYYLKVRNDRGEDRYAVALSVKEPVTMTTVIGIVITCLVMLVIVTICVFYAFKTEKCCFSPSITRKETGSLSDTTAVYGNVVVVERNDPKNKCEANYKGTEVENNKTDIENQKSVAHGRPRPFRVGGTMIGGTPSNIPPDALYVGGPRPRQSSLAKYNHEYENIKALRAALATPPTLTETKRHLRTSNSSSTETSSSTRSTNAHPNIWGKTDERNQDTKYKREGSPWLRGSSRPTKHDPFGTGNFHDVFSTKLPTNFAPPSPSLPPSRVQRESNNNLSSFETPLRASAKKASRFEPGVNSPRRQGADTAYAELQLPLPHGLNRVADSYPSTRVRRTQYAEITFQKEPLQSAHI